MNMEWLTTNLVLPLIGVAVGYVSRLLLTRRERKKSDLEIINSAISPLLDSVRQLTEQNSQLVDKLAVEQKSVLEYMEKTRNLLQERAELVSKIDKLSRQVETLKKMLKEYIKDSPISENSNNLNSI